MICYLLFLPLLAVSLSLPKGFGESTPMSPPMRILTKTKAYGQSTPTVYPLYWTTLWKYQHPLNEPELCDIFTDLRQLVLDLEQKEHTTHKSNKGGWQYPKDFASLQTNNSAVAKFLELVTFNVQE